jgi:divalent metal cation (Fe/Co/Zn/Cd) transporter
MLFEGYAWSVAMRERRGERKGRGWLETLDNSKDPTTFTVLFEDSAAMIGLGVAFLGVFLGERFDNPYFDGMASVVIGIILAVVAVFLARQSKGLLIGEAVDPRIRDSVYQIAEADPQVRRATRILTMHLGPREVLLALELEFERGLSAGDAAAAIERIDAEIRRRHPEIKHIFIESQSLGATKKSAGFADAV